LSQRLEDIRAALDNPVNEEGWIPFFIPVIIKGLVGDALTYVMSLYKRTLLTFSRLGQICMALDYSEESLSKLQINMS
jgi:hypothetical protein